MFELTKQEIKIIRKSQRLIWRLENSKIRKVMFNRKNDARWNRFIRERLYENIKSK